MSVKCTKHQKQEIISTQLGYTGYLANLSIGILSLCTDGTQLKSNKLKQL